MKEDKCKDDPSASLKIEGEGGREAQAKKAINIIHRQRSGGREEEEGRDPFALLLLLATRDHFIRSF